MEISERMARTRRYHKLSTWLSIAFLTALPATDLVLGSYSVERLVAGAVLLAAVMVQFGRILLRSLDGMGRGGFGPLQLGATFGVALCALLVMLPAVRPELRFVWALLPGAVVGAVAVILPAGRRARVILGGAGVVGVSVLGLAWQVGLPAGEALFAALVTVMMGGLMLMQYLTWELAVELDNARAAAGDLAVAQERLRFAADLHDIQGHHLQAIALKAELVTRLVGMDDDAARRQASEIQRLAAAALTDTRQVVGGYRAVSLGTEIDNATGILAAAGIAADVHGEAAAVPDRMQRLFGLLVREGTTNVLRHGGVGRCTIDVLAEQDPVVVQMRNDRVGPGTDRPAGSGLAGLRERFAAAGGRVDAGRHGEEFVLRGEVPA